MYHEAQNPLQTQQAGGTIWGLSAYVYTHRMIQVKLKNKAQVEENGENNLTYKQIMGVRTKNSTSEGCKRVKSQKLLVQDPRPLTLSLANRVHFNCCPVATNRLCICLLTVKQIHMCPDLSAVTYLV